jgi:UDP-2,3-diacylglucosamine pyrophosphatase LpxH
MTPGGTKKIFISDIHMGDARSQAGDHPYGWLYSNISNLANFLEEQLIAPDVAEVVILGDLFDTWVIPTILYPLNSYEEIYSNDENSPVIEALKKLAAESKLSYVPGNHDMAFSTTDLAGTKQFMETRFPGIRYICDPDLPTGVYRSGKLVAEHGNRYCLFNAPDTWTKQPSFLPIGYFISRLVAYKVYTTGTPEDFHDILKKFIMQLIKRPNFVQDLYEAIAKDAGLADTDIIEMNGIASFPGTITVGGISAIYGQLIQNWESDPNRIGWEIAAREDAGDLALAANHILFSSGQDIVVFGHTHVPTLKRIFLGEPLEEGVDIHLDLPCHAIYANSGTWVDSVKSTYVETQEDAGRQYVRLWNYPSKTLLREAFVEL